jgi:phosphoribosyl 1,2-cyclic phosphate phosphodiesterase
MRVTFLGTGTSTGVPILTCRCAVCTSNDPHDKRTRPSLLVEYDGHAVVIDTTPDFRFQVLREGLERLDAVLYTHPHADHILGLDDVRVFYFRQQRPIPIYADAHSMENIQRTFKYIFDGTYRYGGLAKLAPHLIEGPFKVGDLEFIPVRVYHGDLPILGYRFGAAAYLTDASAIPEESFQSLEGLDVLVLDALRHKPHPTHMSIDQALDIVARVKPRRAFFTHMTHDLGHEATNALLPPHVRLAYDGLRLEL